jgi:GGDEF domain-containing protein
MQRLRYMAWMLLAACLLLIAFVARIYTRSVVAPIKAISRGFRRIEENPQADPVNLPHPRTRDEIGEMVRSINTFLDTRRARRESAELIWHQANFDILTGLPNRRLFKDWLDEEAKKATRDHRMISLCFVDLDRFKEINDTLGHDTGDALLVQAARRLEGSVRSSDTVGRFGVDEFSIILSAVTPSATSRPSPPRYWPPSPSRSRSARKPATFRRASASAAVPATRRTAQTC